MAKNQNTYEKLRREMEKKRKAQEKRAGKLRRKEMSRLPEQSDDADPSETFESPAARGAADGKSE